MIGSKNPWNVISRSETYTCPYFTVRSDKVSFANRKPSTYNSIRMKVFGVAILPIDKDGCTTFVGQYRYVLDRYSWELPGGGASHDKTAIESAQMELSEETGYRADHWLQILAAPAAPGTTDEIFSGFVAWGLRTGRPHPEPEEELALRKIPFREAVSMALRGEVGHIASVATLLSVQTLLARDELPLPLATLLRGEGNATTNA
jgi:8-oxo-dGTP pyrophosphatase MutT (NUDIX family)